MEYLLVFVALVLVLCARKMRQQRKALDELKLKIDQYDSWLWN